MTKFISTMGIIGAAVGMEALVSNSHSLIDVLFLLGFIIMGIYLHLKPKAQ